MPSRKNRSLKKNKRRNTTCKIHQNYDYNEEDIVWAKLAGYPIWPGKITSKIAKKFNVLFYGDHTTTCLSEAKLIPFQLMEPILPVKRPLLQAAIFEALEEFNLKSQALNSVSIPAAQQNNTSAEPEPLCSRCTEPGPDDCVVAFRTTDDLAVNTDVNNSEAAKLEALRLEWDRMDVDKPMKPACVLNLKSMDNVDIVNTFALHENILTKMFHKNLPFPDHRVESQSKLNYLLVLNEVVTPEQQVVMYHKLRDTLTGETNSISSNHENLIWKIILPEWCISIFMDRFSLTREESLTQIKMQDSYEVSRGFDLSF